MLKENLLPSVIEYVNRSEFKSHMFVHGRVKVQFLAQGEYNLNYLLDTSRGKFVFRINTASQMQLENQINYEYQALQLLQNTKVTPKAYYLDDSKAIIPFGLLLMEYLPGDHLDYRYDLFKAAGTFAKIHGMQFEQKDTLFLVREERPFTAILREAKCLIQKYWDCPEGNLQVKQQLEKVLLMAEDKRKEEAIFLQEPWLAVINTEVNSHNFIVNEDKRNCHLIDWEKPILGEPAQDLSMFFIATTTMWKRNYVLSREDEETFIREYVKKMPDCSQKRTLKSRIEMFKFFNYLRAISWCAMAWTEYMNTERQLVNHDTFDRISSYIDPFFIKKNILNRY